MPQTDTSWWDWLIAGLSRKGDVPPPPPPPPPPRPAPPKVDDAAWAKNLEHARISPYLTVHELGLIVFGETQPFAGSPNSSESITMGRQKLAHTIINADDKWGAQRMRHAKTHGAVEPSESALRNPAVRAAYESSMQAAREAFLSGSDPTNGAVHFYLAGTPNRSNLRYAGGTAQGVPLSTQSGPYSNSYTGRDVKSRTVWLNTYWEK